MSAQSWATYGFKSADEYNAYMRDYRARNIERIRAYNRRYNSEWRKKNGYHNEAKWEHSNPQKVKAQSAVQYAVKTGKLEKGPCEFCGTAIDVVGHHDDYTKPLTVRWLCRLHHRHVHYGNKIYAPH